MQGAQPVVGVESAGDRYACGYCTGRVEAALFGALPGPHPIHHLVRPDRLLTGPHRRVTDARAR